MERARLSFGNGGWVRYLRSDLPAVVYVRCEDREGRLELVEVYVEALDGAAVTPDLVRQVPIGDIDAGVNAHASAVRARLDIPGPDLRRLARHFAATFGAAARHWVADAWRAQFPGSGVPQAKMPTLRRAEVPEVNATLDIPIGGYTDDFYRRVAEVYRRLAAHGERKPAVVIAERNRVEPSTARGWVKRARQRGFLEGGRRGKVG